MNLSAFVFALAVAAPAAGTSTGETTPPPTATALTEVRLEVDHSALLAQQMADAAEDSAFFVREDGSKALREQHGVDVVDDADAPAIIVKLAWKDYEGSVYRIEIAARPAGEAPQVVEAFEATCINNTALTKAVVAKFPAALERLAKPQRTSAPEPVVDDPVTEPGEDQVVGEEPVDDHPERVPLGPTGKAGIGLLAAGAAGVIAGGIVFAQQRKLDEDPTALDWEGKDYRPPGIGVMVAGGVVAVTGAVLLIIDRSQARRARKPARPTARLVPTPAGLAITGRF